MSRSWSSSDMTACSTMVGANRSRAACSASAWPRSTNTTCRPESSSVSGPNIGCTEVTRQPCDLSAISPPRSGDLSDPRSKMTPVGRRSASSRSTASVWPSGVATTMKSWSRGESASAASRVAPGGAPAGSQTSTAKPCDSRKSANQRPILPAPPMTSARRPLPCPCAATLACSWVVSELRISMRIRSSATCGGTPCRSASARAPRITSRSRP